MRRLSFSLVLGLLFLQPACTAHEPKAEEPVEKTKAKDDDAGAFDMDDGAGKEGGGMAPEAPPPMPEAAPDMSDDAFDAPMPQDAPANAAPAPAPKPSGGGIISSGVKPRPEDACKKLATVREQKACMERLRKSGKKQN